jgi:hypothetical protein
LILWGFGLCHFIILEDGISVNFCRGFGGDMFCRRYKETVEEFQKKHDLKNRVLFLERQVKAMADFLNIKECRFGKTGELLDLGVFYKKIEKCEHCGQEVKSE